MPKWNEVLVALSLVALTLLVFWPVTDCEFVDLDDLNYVTTNPQVQQGLTRESAAWAFTTGEAANWHPLTWLSLMLDYDCYGLQPAGYHRTNLLLHAANVAILFLLLKAMTGAAGRSALVAALFAVYPLRVESVAWVSERKDVLCAFFGLLAIAAYVRYARAPGVLRYSLVLVLLALSLMAKPMLVTLPCLLLLLDFWPLGRLKPDDAPATGERAEQPPPLIAREKLLPLVLEKLPLVALAVASSVVTFLAQRGQAVRSLDSFSGIARLENLPIAYVRYLGKMFRFDHLAAFYPYPAAWPLWQVAACASFLIAAALAVLWRLRANPWLAVGWFWYLGLLVPVIGLVQVGDQSLADRYTYLPTIGLLILFAWSLPEWLFRSLGGRLLLAVAAAAALAGLSFFTRTQIGYWHDSKTLFNHALAVTQDNDVAHNCLGVALLAEGRAADAVVQFQSALKMKPSEMVYANLGSAQRALGHLQEAVDAFTMAAERQTDLPEVYQGRADAYGDQGKFRPAIADYDRAIELNPRGADAFFGRGNAHLRLGHPAAAIKDYSEAIRLKPGFAKAYNNRGAAYERSGRLDEALADLTKAIEFNPEYAEAYFNRSRIYTRLAKGDPSFARRAVNDLLAFRRLAVDPMQSAELLARTATTYVARAEELGRRHAYRQARDYLDFALQLEPDFVVALNSRAWLLATCPDESVRDGKQAAGDATRASELASWNTPELLDTLAAAWAERGDFESAVRWSTKALELAHGNEALARDLRARLELYRAGKPFRDEPPAEPSPADPEKGKS